VSKILPADLMHSIEQFLGVHDCEKCQKYDFTLRFFCCDTSFNYICLTCFQVEEKEHCDDFCCFLCLNHLTGLEKKKLKISPSFCDACTEKKKQVKDSFSHSLLYS
jgi:hypothetical protein